MTRKSKSFQPTVTRLSMWLSCGLGACLSNYALAEVADPALQRVEVTGSSIKRIAAEGALPVSVIRAEEIRASGATSAVDLIRKISSSQGGTVESGSVGGSSYGFAGVSIHNVGETRTLVLLNGRRLAQFGGQTLTGFAAGFDLNAIPISAIDRVELLTDGASALYGADAIAGVVNFITKRKTTEGDISIGVSAPQKGATETRFSASKGFGDRDKDGFNGFISFGHDERTQLFSTDREFASTGKTKFNYQGKSYQKQQFSASPIPANALDDKGQLISPYQKKTGSCPPKTFRVIEPYNDGTGMADDYCGFDFVGELEIYPERKRDSFMASVTGDFAGQELFADVLLARTNTISRIAPVPGSISIPAGSALANKYLVPIGITGDSTAFYRLYDLGKRTNNDTADFKSISFGSRGDMVGWDYAAAYSYSESDVRGSVSGYPGALAVSALRKSGLLDPFVSPGSQSAAAQSAINAANFNGYWDGGVAQLNTINLNGSRPVGKLDGGAIMLGVGFNLNSEKFESKPSLFAQGKLANPVTGTLCDPADPTKPCDTRFGDSSTTPPYTASRTSAGLFGELVLPVSKSLELGVGVRTDKYSDFGSANTAKVNFRFSPSSQWMMRGSAGTGFHAPTVPQVNATLRDYGVTSDKYTCTAALQAKATSLGAICQSGNRQYDQMASGNPSLTPEKSIQTTLGVRFEPNDSMSFGVDLWQVNISDAFGQLTEQLVFGDPAAYSQSWTTKVDIGTGKKYLAFLADNKNLGNSITQGLDFDIQARSKTSVGLINSQLTITYMLRDEAQLEKNGTYYSSVGNFAELGTVSFKTKGRWATSLKNGDWSHTVGVNFQSGYDDLLTKVDVLDSADVVTATEDIRMKVEAYLTYDWQTVWAPSKSWSLTAGMLNLMDTKPPFVPSTGGLGRGQQFGYDDRYYDPRGRTLYANASYKF